jgi:cytochrome P450
MSLLDFVRDPTNFQRNLFNRWSEKRPKLFKMNGPGFTAVIATHPDSAKWVLSNPELFPKTTPPINLKNMPKLISNNILNSNGEDWRRFRNVLSPPFHFDAVKEWIPEFHTMSLELMNLWRPIIDKPVNITKWMPLFTVDVLGKTVMSKSFDAMKGKEDRDLDNLSYMLNNLVRPSTFVVGLLEGVIGRALPIELNKRIIELSEGMRGLVKGKKGNPFSSKFDIVDAMLSAHDPTWTEDEVVAVTFLLFTAGHETTASALSWMFYHLAINQPVQQRLIDEVSTVLKGQPVTKENIKELRYLNNTIKENMRMQPPVTNLTTREVAEDTEFEGQIVPKGCMMGVGIYALHHSPEFWESPEEFNPDRFDKPFTPFSYVPFSMKSRACLGNQFSLLEQAVFLATLFQHYRITGVTEFKQQSRLAQMNKPESLHVSIAAL